MKIKLPIGLSLLVVGSVFLFVLTALTALALSAGGIGGVPANVDPGVKYSDSWFIYNLDAGESITDSIHLINSSDKIEAIKIYAVDSIASNQGNFALEAHDDPKDGIGAWVTLPVSEITMDPGKEYDMPFTMTVPENADVGEHSGGIILQKASVDDVSTGSIGATIVTRVGIRIYETVPGEVVRNVELADFRVELVKAEERDPVYQATLKAVNRSNISLQPDVTLEIIGWGRESYLPKSSAEDSGFVINFADLGRFFQGETMTRKWQLLRDEEVSTNWEWPAPLFGSFSFRARISYEGTNGPEELLTPVVTVHVVPWREVIVLGGLLLVLLLLLIALRFRYRSWKEYTVRPGDQLPVIAKQAGIDWKELVRVNRLKEPVVEAGVTIRVPKKFQPAEVQPPIVAQAHEIAREIPEEAVTPAVKAVPEETDATETPATPEPVQLPKPPIVKSRVIPIRVESVSVGKKKVKKRSPRKRLAKKSKQSAS
ncbi:MAG: LysM peptidoglycan-binding domain-containing protein [Patescibacteria group bacterium]